MQGEYPSLNVSIEALLQFQQRVGISGPMSCLRGGYLWYQVPSWGWVSPWVGMFGGLVCLWGWILQGSGHFSKVKRTLFCLRVKTYLETRKHSRRILTARLPTLRVLMPSVAYPPSSPSRIFNPSPFGILIPPWIYSPPDK